MDVRIDSFRGSMGLVQLYGGATGGFWSLRRETDLSQAAF